MARFDLADATVVLTGGSRGIGPHIASALAERGARIALVARSAPELEANVRALRDSGARAIAIAADVTSPADRIEIVQRAERELGPVDVLVNNAGGDPQREFHHLDEDEIEAVLDLNLTSPVILSRLVLPGMLARGRGHIVSISSMAGRTGFPFTEAYAAAKDGLIGFTRVLRGDYRRRGVSGSTLILGPVGQAGVGRGGQLHGGEVGRVRAGEPDARGLAPLGGEREGGRDPGEVADPQPVVEVAPAAVGATANTSATRRTPSARMVVTAATPNAIAEARSSRTS